MANNAMDSDVSADGDSDEGSPYIRPNVNKHPEQVSSPDMISDNEESSIGGSSPQMKTASSSAVSSPADIEVSRESSPGINGASSDEESDNQLIEKVNFGQESSSESITKVYNYPSPSDSRKIDSPEELFPETRNHFDLESSPEIKATSLDEESDQDSSQEAQNYDFDKDSSPEFAEQGNNEPKDLAPKGNVELDQESLPDVESDKTEGGVPAAESVMPEPSDESYSNNNYTDLNGDVCPKKSSSVVSEIHSDIASSLDSVSPSQFEESEAKVHVDDKDADKTINSFDKKKTIIDFADDLSDVSDIESNDSLDIQEKLGEGKEENIIQEEQICVKQLNRDMYDDKNVDTVSVHDDGDEQLDFEAEEGECSPKVEKTGIIEDYEEEQEDKKEMPRVEKKEQSDLEEGELSDDNDTKPEETERPVCRFFSRGHCTWGSNCRFIHPGVLDKGNYSMFDTVRPIVTPGGPPPPLPPGPMLYPGLPSHIVPPHIVERQGIFNPGIIRKDEPTESAWERGLRQAKEMIRKSSKRKETEVDFEDKKMNLTLSQDELDKENDYYSRHSRSPPNKSPDLDDKWKMEVDIKTRGEGYPNDAPSVPHGGGGDAPPLGYYPALHHRPDYWNHRMGSAPYDEYSLRGPHAPYGGGPDYYAATPGRRYMHPNSFYQPRPNVGPPAAHSDLYDRKQKHKSYQGLSREVIVQKPDKPYKDERYRGRRDESPRLERSRDDEWADPWMRTKSPATGRRRRGAKNKYSSGSSYSSSSSRSHNSRSRSKARSSGTGSHSSSRSVSETQTNKKPIQFKLSPTSRQQLPAPKRNTKVGSPNMIMERRLPSERPVHAIVEPPSPKIKMRPHSPPGSAVGSQSSAKGKCGLPDRILTHSKAAVAAAMRSNRSSSRSSKSSSGSSSSESSSDSSDSDSSSSSSSKSPKATQVRVQKRIVPEDHASVSQTVKVKAMDAMKLSGQKQQIKLTLKGSNSNASKRVTVVDNVDSRRDRPTVAGKKRIAESSASGSDSDTPAKKSKGNQKRGPAASGAVGAGGSRREELLKQLKAVEDAIARKRSRNL